jgi:SAM-dependent methyltransferase
VEYVGKDNLDLMSLAENYNAEIRRWLIKGLRPSAEILDFGAGKGEFCNRLTDFSVTAVEIDQHLHQYITCPVKQDLSDVIQSFDMIYSINVLEHIEDDAAIVSQWFEHLRHGGTVKILVPARQEIFSIMDKTVGHIRRYSRPDLIALFRSSHFEVISCRYFDFIGYFASFLFKVLNRNNVFNERSMVIYDRGVFPVSTLLDAMTFGQIIGKNLLLEACKQ